MEQGLIFSVTAESGETSRMSFHKALEAQKEECKTFVNTYSDGGIDGASALKRLSVSADAVAGSDTDRKVILVVRDHSGEIGKAGRVARLCIPAPKLTAFAFESGDKGRRITKASGQACVDAYAEACTLTEYDPETPAGLKFLRGYEVKSK